MTTRTFTVALVIFAAFVLSSCGGASAPDVVATPTSVGTSSNAAAGDNSNTASETATSASNFAAPTDTMSAPTATSAPTASTSSGVSDPMVAIAAFKAAGLEAENPAKMGPKDYGAAPYVGSGIHFLTPSVCSDCGGRVFTFTDPADEAKLKDYYDSLGKTSALFFSWVFTHGNVLVQLNGDMNEDQAQKYNAALQSMK